MAAIGDVLPQCQEWAVAIIRPEHGDVTVGMPALSDCPWCDTRCDYNPYSEIATCQRDDSHKVYWLPHEN